jgi:hypothetical protein
MCHLSVVEYEILIYSLSRLTLRDELESLKVRMRKTINGFFFFRFLAVSEHKMLIYSP